MDKKCKNCKHFRIGSALPATHIWGDCMKPRKYDTFDAQGTKTTGVFMWDDKSCDDFEPRKTLVDQPVGDFS